MFIYDYFIVELPGFKGHKTIMKAVDWFTKFAHLIACDSHVPVPRTIKLFIDNIFAFCLIITEVFSNRGTQFDLKFYNKLLSTWAFNPANRRCIISSKKGKPNLKNTLEKYLCCYTSTNHENLKYLLPTSKLSYNNAAQLTTSMASLFAIYTYKPTD